MGIIRRSLSAFGLLFFALTTYAQNGGTGTPANGEVRDTTYKIGGEVLSLRQCIDYAMLHQPALNKSLISTQIAGETNAVNLAPWLPQVSASGSLIHYIQQPGNGAVVASTGSTTGTTTTASSTRTSISNSFVPGVQVSQAIFSPELLYASHTAPLLLQASKQVTDSTKIFLVTSVTKSFYNLLLTLQQIGVLKEDTARLGKNVTDAYHQYKGGIVDETDYEEASISLNNSKAQLKEAQENIIPQYAALKQLIGYPVNQQFNVAFDTLRMKSDINMDTLQQLQFEKRIEFQQLNTQKALQDQLLHYYNTQYLPTLSAFFNYNLEFQNNRASDLFQNSYPSSLVGLSFSIPIFTGFARVHNVKKAQLQEQLIDWDRIDLKSQINKEYTTALATYKSNRYNLELLQKNVTMASRTYFVVTLQYKQGIVPYLNVITAESNLVTSKVNYINALFQVLSSKIDLEKSMGNITY
ncbi:TolC family protein [Mucilaginibacter sp. dw_454]|uniref:TolC family protein n=1 Tax=Mucilaginibacter sp. dw_454 TaxID=2720079 RepID=UPI001BD2A384|nr:TolC family protein [Mucilaginibacter sp. dw_454]